MYLASISFMVAIAVAALACGGGESELDRLLQESEVDCGTLTFDNVGQSCPDSAAALQCFESSQRPHIEQVFISDEGDPIYQHFFLDGDRVVLIHDTREDDFGPQEITRFECSGGVEISEPTVGGCLHVVCAR